MKKIFFWFLLISSALAQNTVTVTAANIHNGSSGLLPSGTILFQAVNSNGQLIAYQIGGTGPNIVTPTICPIVTGAISGTCKVANVAVANPVNFCFSVTVKNSTNQVVLGGPNSGYQCTQPTINSTWCTAGVCDFDNYQPTLPSSVLVINLAGPSTNVLGGVNSTLCSAGSWVLGYLSTGSPSCFNLNLSSGTCVNASSATCIVTFTDAYSSPPVCTASDQTNILTGLQAVPSTTNLLINTSSPNSDTYSYICLPAIAN